MRILYHHRTLADGAEGIHIHEMIEAFHELGHEVELASIASSDRRGEGRPGLAATLRGALPQWSFELAAAAYSTVEFQQFRRRLATRRAALLYKRHAIYDAGVLEAARRAGVPSILEVNCPYSSPQHRRFERVHFPSLARRFERRAVDAATVVAAVSSPMANYLRTLARDPAKIIVVANGANPARFVPSETSGRSVRERYRVPADATILGWAGILRDWHRVDFLVQALPRVPTTWLLVVGDGPDRPRLEDEARRHGVSGRVVIAGRVPHDEMPAHVASFDIAAAADDRTGYASPMKLLEYMAMARPVLAPDLPNIADFLTTGVEGLLFRRGDAAHFAELLEALVRDPALRQRLGAAGRRRIEIDRNWRHNAEIVLAALAARTGSSP
jgi:glycosyltransferase involved in cell wall biosynthesis